MRVTGRDDLDAAAHALTRCAREVLTPVVDSPIPERPDLGRELLTCFGAPGLAFPYVPPFAVDQLHVQDPATFTTFEVDRKELYLMLGVLDELLKPLQEPRFAVSYWGHGMNSYAWTVRLERPGLRMVLQRGYGGVYPSSDQDEQLAQIFSLSRQLDLLVPHSRERDIVVVFSRMRGMSAAGFAAGSGTRLRGWIEGNRAEDLVEAVDALLTGPSDPEQPWQDLTSAFLHALRQTAGTGCDTIAFETPGYVVYLTTDVHDGPITATIMPTDEQDEARELDSDAQASSTIRLALQPRPSEPARRAGLEDLALERSDVHAADQLVVDRGYGVLPQLRLGPPRAEVPRHGTHVAVQQLVPGLGATSRCCTRCTS
jgi:hypothetical protein